MISSSALRRLATPACDRIFWRRSSAFSSSARPAGPAPRSGRRPRVPAGDRSWSGALVVGSSLRPASSRPKLLELLQRRQFAHILQVRTEPGTPSWSCTESVCPTTFFRPGFAISFRSSRVFSTPAPWTPRISMISGAVTGCLYAITASVSSAGQRQLQRRLQFLDERANRFVMLRLGGHLVAAGHFANRSVRVPAARNPPPIHPAIA